MASIFSLKGKKAIVTGGARGLGLEMSRGLAEAGADVALMYVSDDKTHDTAAEIAKQYGVVCKAYKAEITNAKAVKDSIDQIHSDFGGIDIFVANAGISIGGAAEYNCTKGAVSSMAKCLATEWATRGVRVNAINPGYMRTEMLDKIFATQPELAAAWTNLIPMRRMGNPKELKGAVVFLASDASSYVTGSELYVDGGYTAV